MGKLPPAKLTALTLALKYALGALLWLVVSDALTTRLEPDSALADYLSTAKEAGFITVTAMLLFSLIQRYHDATLRAHGQVRERERRLRLALQGSRSALWDWDVASGRLELSEQFADVLGLGSVPEDIEAWRARIHPADRVRVAARWQNQNLRPGESYEDTYRVLDGQSRYRWVKVKGRLFGGDHGRLVGTVVDHTEPKRTQDAMRLAVAVLDHTSEGVMITNADLRIVAVNRAFTAITGYDETQAIGSTPQLLKSDRHDQAFYADMWRAIREQGHWQGEIWNRRKDGLVYPEWLTVTEVHDETGSLVNYVGIFADISAHKRSAAQIEQLRHYDALTGLPNRLSLEEHLRRALARPERRALLGTLSLDLDHFKDINDTLGHSLGDRLLQLAAERLRAVLEHADFIARPGGDQFVVVAARRQRADFASLAERLLAALQEAFAVDGQKLFLSASIGIAAGGSETGVAALLKHSEAAMYRAKQDGRDRYRFYSPELGEPSRERVVLGAALRHALEREELEVFYQPQVSLASGDLVGAEALVRWRHPELGLIPPARFLPVAEELGLIRAIDAWVLRRACAQARQWQQAGRPLRIAVNVSGSRMSDRDLLQDVRSVLEATGLPAPLLELELTEGLIMQTPEQTAAVLTALNALGVQLAIDDFGTGYSSLSYLKRFPVHRLKIDQSFVRDLPASLESAAIARAVIALGRSLDLEVLAEGIEDAPQRAWLYQAGCGEGQGYHFGTPMDAAAFAAYAAVGSPDLPPSQPSVRRTSRT